MALITFIFSAIVGMAPGTSNATPIQTAAGLDLGGNATFLFSDPGIQAFGLGAGYQASLFATMWNDRPIGGKLRIETVAFREEAVQKSSTDYMSPGSLLKSMTQKWNIISMGAEGRFAGHGQILFWEALLGYAMGGPAVVALTSSQADQGLLNTDQTTRSGFAVSGGLGIKRVFSPKLTGLMSFRTLFVIGSPYSSDALVNRAYIPFPLMFSVGAEFPFQLGN